MAQIFISFVHEEEEIAEVVQRFLQDLMKKQADVFLSSDKWKIYAGEIWLKRIYNELKEARVVLLMLSPLSVARPWVNFEAGAAWLADKIIIPVCFGGLSKGSLPKPYSSIQAIDLYDRNDQYYLITSVCHHLRLLGPPPAPLRQLLTDHESDSDLKPYDDLRRALENFAHSLTTRKDGKGSPTDQ